MWVSPPTQGISTVISAQLHVLVRMHPPQFLTSQHTGIGKQKGSFSLTTADKFPFLNLSYIMAPQVGRPHTLSVEAHPRPLAQPVREPGQVAVTIQVVRMESTKWGQRRLKQENRKELHSKLGKFIHDNIHETAQHVNRASWVNANLIFFLKMKLVPKHRLKPLFIYLWAKQIHRSLHMTIEIFCLRLFKGAKSHK